MLILDSDLPRQELPPPDLFVQPLGDDPHLRLQGGLGKELKPSDAAFHDLVRVTQEAWRHALS